MKLGICIYSNDPESVWNAFRFANDSIKHCQDDGRGAYRRYLDEHAMAPDKSLGAIGQDWGHECCSFSDDDSTIVAELFA